MISRKLTLSIGLLAALLMLAAPAQAETWSCAYTAHGKLVSGVFVRKRGGFTSRGGGFGTKKPIGWTILNEDEDKILLFASSPKLWKRKNLLVVLWKPDHNNEKEKIGLYALGRGATAGQNLYGSCTVH